VFRTTVGQLLINEALPEGMRNYTRVLDKAGVRDLFEQIAKDHPDRYAEIAHDISNIGHSTATETGGYSFGVGAIRTPASTRLAIQKLEGKLHTIRRNSDLSDDQKELEVLKATREAQTNLQKTVYESAKAEGHPVSQQVLSGARGNPVNLNSLLGADLLYVDHRNRAIPMPVLRNYSQGLRPAEYFAGAFGARKGIVDLKLATANAGFLGKQLSQVSHRLIVSGDDDEEDNDPETIRGLPVDTDDAHNAGALLAHPAGEYPRNTVLTPKVIKAIKAAGHDSILIRSPMVGGPRDGGVYARDAGVREKGRIAPIGDYVGIAAAQALSAPITQSQISSKHSGGVAGASAGGHQRLRRD
jgi:DNA-directed RNA polymerase subunit beta'